MTSRDLLVWLNSIPGMGGIRTRAVCDYFGSAEEAAKAGPDQLSRIKGIGKKTARAIANSDPEAFLKQEHSRASSESVRIVTIEDGDYPEPLRSIFDPPSVLYIKGSMRDEDMISLAVVGSRRCSVYGKTQAQKFARGLSLRGFTVVSGCAVGIDTAAHRACIEAGGRTIGVVGSGLMEPYPKSNISLMRDIAKTGAVVSEFHLKQKVERGNFVRRNRVISGLSLGVIVAEAAKKSGALITAKHAAEQGREVFAVPGNVDSPRTKGAHALIKDGARLVETVDDILEELGDIARFLPERKEDTFLKRKPVTLSSKEESVYSLVESEPLNIEDLISRSGLGPGSVGSILVMLELKNLVKELPGKKYVRV